VAHLAVVVCLGAVMTNDYLSADRADATAQRLASCYNALAGLNPEGVAEAVKALEWAMTHVENVFALAGRHDRERPQLEAARCALAAVRQP